MKQENTTAGTSRKNASEGSRFFSAPETKYAGENKTPDLTAKKHSSFFDATLATWAQNAEAHDDDVAGWNNQFVFHPRGNVMKRWSVLMMFCLLYTSFVTTYEITFIFAGSTVPRGLWIFNRAIDTFFCTDVLVNFNTAYYHKSGMLMESRSYIMANYVRGWFILDLVSTIPWSELAFLQGGTETSVLRLVRLLRVSKLLRIIKTNRIVKGLLRAGFCKLSTWGFIKSIGMLSVCIHWSTCLWMIVAQQQELMDTWVYNYLPECVENYKDGMKLDPVDLTQACQISWQHLPTLQSEPAKFVLQNGMDPAVSANATTAFLLSHYGVGNYTGPNWYYVSMEYTLAAFGVWAFDGPEPTNVTEGWFSVVTTLIAASVYAYLAGVVIDLVAQRGASDREINGLLDSILDYLEVLQFPVQRRKEFIHFFWQSRPYLMNDYRRSQVPYLSPLLEGKLAKFKFSHVFETVPFFRCKDLDETGRFHSEVARKFSTSMFVSTETILVDALHMILEGLVGNLGRRKQGIATRNRMFGVEQCLDFDKRVDPTEAVAVTFVACSVLQADSLSEVLATGQFPTMEKVTHQFVLKLSFMRMMRCIVQRAKEQHAAHFDKFWSAAAMQEYKQKLVAISHASGADKVKISRELFANKPVIQDSHGHITEELFPGIKRDFGNDATLFRSPTTSEAMDRMSVLIQRISERIGGSGARVHSKKVKKKKHKSAQQNNKKTTPFNRRNKLVQSKKGSLWTAPVSGAGEAGGFNAEEFLHPMQKILARQLKMDQTMQDLLDRQTVVDAALAEKMGALSAPRSISKSVFAQEHKAPMIDGVATQERPPSTLQNRMQHVLADHKPLSDEQVARKEPTSSPRRKPPIRKIMRSMEERRQGPSHSGESRDVFHA
jgi:hypothetical protein